MRTVLAAAMAALLLAGCATGRISDSERLALYRQHAGEPVRDFQYFGSLNGWTELGDRALAVWTRPREAFVLELNGPCGDLAYAPAIAITHRMGRVSARFDEVIVLGVQGGGRIPCRIQSIRPLDVDALKASEKDLREARLQERRDAAE